MTKRLVITTKYTTVIT